MLRIIIKSNNKYIKKYNGILLNERIGHLYITNFFKQK